MVMRPLSFGDIDESVLREASKLIDGDFETEVQPECTLCSCSCSVADRFIYPYE